MQGIDTLFSILLFAPLIGALLNGLRFRSSHGVTAGAIGTTAVGVSFLAACGLFFELLGKPAGERILTWTPFNWLSVGDLNLGFGFFVDPVSAVMILIITGVGSLIHLFSIGYMSHDNRPAKYFSYLNLFVFNMLVLVLGDSLPIMFIGWEGVGLCSYLLIGFWFTDRAKAVAGMKAFITNRIGDAGFLLGIFILFFAFGTLNFSDLNARMPIQPEYGFFGPIALACLFLFVGATGKSAQIPLYVWLPDAMAGPTPVSALIHAATMVTAGVYMIVRMSPVFVMAPDVLTLIAWVGALTALGGATIGLTQWDIKKVLAYSTVSQLGFMFLACGVGAFGAAMFHLMTHAFFKALMFLGSGSVIHAMHEEQDIRKMGGLRKWMPITHGTFLLGWLAIIGMPPFAGFFSKDEILWLSFSSPFGHWSLWVVGAIAAVFTAFYMTRLMALTFWGHARHDKDVHPHESPFSMTLPLMVLGFLSVVGGWFGIPHVMSAILPGHPPHILENWLHGFLVKVEISHASAAMEWALMGISVAMAGLSAWLAFRFYLIDPGAPKRVTDRFPRLYEAVSNKYWVDEVYYGWIIYPVVNMGRGLWLFVDAQFIDRATYVVTDLVKGAGSFVRSFQSGKAQSYALYIALGLVFTITFALMGS